MANQAIISAKLVLSNPEKYGFVLIPEDFYPLLEFDRVRIMCRQKTPVLIIAQAAKTHFSVIKELNPEIRGHYIYKGTHTLLIPKGAAEAFHPRYEELSRKWEQKRHSCIYEVQKGDNLSIIADRFNIPLPALLIWNNHNTKKYLHPGDQLVVCPNEVEFTGNRDD